MMSRGRWVVVAVAVGLVAGGLWLRAAAWQQYRLAQGFYHDQQELVGLLGRHLAQARLADREGLAREVPGTLAALATLQPPNGRARLTWELELTLGRGLAAYARREASPSLGEIEDRYGRLCGRWRDETPAAAWPVAPRPHTVPSARPRRFM